VRSQGATFSWRGAPHDALVVIVTTSVDQFTSAGAICYCTARAEVGHLTMPPEMFAHFPATRRLQGLSRSGSMVMTVRLRTATPPVIVGLDQLRLASTYASIRRTDFE
jgi:hypothetical protein